MRKKGTGSRSNQEDIEIASQSASNDIAYHQIEDQSWFNSDGIDEDSIDNPHFNGEETEVGSQTMTEDQDRKGRSRNGKFKDVKAKATNGDDYKHYWEHDETKTLIESYAIHGKDLNNPKKKDFVYDHIANDMVSNKYNVTATQCRNKWNNLLRSYKKHIDGVNTTGSEPSKFHFFKSMDDILGDKPTMSCPHAVGSMDPDHDSLSDDSPTEVANKSSDPIDSEKKRSKKKPARLLESEIRQKQHDERIAMQKEKNELEIKLQEEKINLKKSIQEDKNTLKMIQRREDAELKKQLEKDRQDFNLKMLREKLSFKGELMNRKLEVETNKTEVERSKITVIERYVELKSKSGV